MDPPMSTYTNDGMTTERIRNTSIYGLQRDLGPKITGSETRQNLSSGLADKARLKPVSSATESGKKIEICLFRCNTF